MRLLLLNYEYPPAGGGAANATLFVGRALAALGHQPVVMTASLAGQPRISSVAGVRVIRIPAVRRTADRSGVYEMASFLLASLICAKHIASRERIDAAIAFFTIPSGPAALLLRKLAGVPYVVSLRGGDVPGHVPHIRRLHALTGPLRRAVLHNARAVVANSRSLALRSQAADPIPVQVIPNGVDTELYFPAPAAVAECGTSNTFRILFVGRVHPEKSVDDLLYAAADLVREGLDLAVDIVGDGSQRDVLQALAASLGIADRVRWLGWRPKEEVAAVYREAACFVNPSQYEGMPNAVLEAMSSGLPTVASDVGGNNDVVIEGETGLLFPWSDRPALSAALRRLAGDRKLRERLGANARALVVSQYSWDSVARRYIDLFGTGAATVQSPVPGAAA